MTAEWVGGNLPEFHKGFYMYSMKKSLKDLVDSETFKNLDCVSKLFFWKKHVFDTIKSDLLTMQNSVLILRSDFMIHDEVECDKVKDNNENNQEVS
jgi:hypothetical protein